MALIEAAMASARALCLPSRHLHVNARSITALSNRAFTSSAELPGLKNLGVKKKRKTRLTSLVLRYKKDSPLCVTNLTDSEWCEKQARFSLVGRRVVNKAAQAGLDRHAELQEEFFKKKKAHRGSAEDNWASKFLGFVKGAYRLLFKGVTRELPIISLVEGEWVTGMIDEIQMPGKGTQRKVFLIDVKTRSKPSLPAKPQQQRGRLQLMLYKHMWDSLMSSNFPAKDFFERFSLNPHVALSESIFDTSRNLGVPATTLEEMIGNFSKACSMFPVSQDEMIIRYESQMDKSLLGEDRFVHDPDWLMKQIRGSLEFWRGEREASFVSEQERWKCRYCVYASKCPASNANLEKESTSSSTNSTMDNKLSIA